MQLLTTTFKLNHYYNAAYPLTFSVLDI